MNIYIKLSQKSNNLIKNVYNIKVNNTTNILKLKNH